MSGHPAEVLKFSSEASLSEFLGSWRIWMLLNSNATECPTDCSPLPHPGILFLTAPYLTSCYNSIWPTWRRLFQTVCRYPHEIMFFLFLSILLVFRPKTSVLRRPVLLCLHISYNICKHADGIEHGTGRNWRVSLCAKALSNVDC